MMNNEDEAIKFGRWLLENAKEAWDGPHLCWKYNGQYYNTDEIYEIFFKQQ